MAAMAVLALCCCGFLLLPLSAEAGKNSKKPLYVRAADTALRIWNASGPGKEQWNYERGVLLYGIQQVWRKTREAKYLQFVKNRTDAFVAENGSIPTYKAADFTLDNVRSGTVLLFLWRRTGLQKYRTAAELLRRQLASQPRTLEGGFWHKLVYPYQMWLDGLFMAEPFYAEYTALFGDDIDNNDNNGTASARSAWDDIVLQFVLMERHARYVCIDRRRHRRHCRRRRRRRLILLLRLLTRACPRAFDELANDP
jgi:unsaturated rhamnogalacturonyl hydrolase